MECLVYLALCLTLAQRPIAVASESHATTFGQAVAKSSAPAKAQGFQQKVAPGAGAASSPRIFPPGYVDQFKNVDADKLLQDPRFRRALRISSPIARDRKELDGPADLAAWFRMCFTGTLEPIQVREHRFLFAAACGSTHQCEQGAVVWIDNRTGTLVAATVSYYESRITIFSKDYTYQTLPKSFVASFASWLGREYDWGCQTAGRRVQSDGTYAAYDVHFIGADGRTMPLDSWECN